MKLIILLTVILKIAIVVNICSSPFTNIRKLTSPFSGRFTKSADKYNIYNMKKESNFETLEIEVFEKIGKVNFILKNSADGNKKDTPEFYYYPKLNCNHLYYYCMLRYLSIELGMFKIKQIAFEIPSDDKGCETKLRNTLNSNQLCRVDYAETDYQVFVIPFQHNGNETLLRFYTQNKRIETTDGLVITDIQLVVTQHHVVLEANGHSKTFISGADSCYLLLKKIDILLNPQVSCGTRFNYYNFEQLNPNALEIVPQGELD
jgi:hypothetical protein